MSPKISARWLCALLVAATIAAYLPALSAGFIWDDDGHVTRADLRSLAGLFRIWFEPGATQQYYPLLHSAFWVEHLFWGDAPLGYHLVNILLHAANACLFAALLRRLAIPGAWLAALLFALHPVAVESVAWITERKNTLSTLFYLGSALTYFRYRAERRAPAYLAATLLFVAALLTKTVTATLPAALLVLVWWQNGRLVLRRDVLPLLPWFVLSAGAALVTARFEHTHIGAQGSDFALTLADRLLIAGRAPWFYAAKLLWPLHLAFIYPRWSLDASSLSQWLYPIATVALLLALVIVARRQRPPLAAALLFGGTLFPALGFINVYPFLFSFVADHFQYLASLALFALAAAALTRLGLTVVRPLGAALALGLGTLTYLQAGNYRDLITLYRAAIAANPGAWLAHHNLASALVEADRSDEAIAHFEKALTLRPDYPEAENNLGEALTRLGRPTEAMTHLTRALALQPRYAEAHNNRGAALMALGRANEGRAAFAEAVRLKPTYAVAHNNLGLALASVAGQPRLGLPHFQTAARLRPDYAGAHLNVALALTALNRFAEAEPEFQRALALDPKSPATFHSYARALAEVGQTEAAVAADQRALDLDPDFFPARDHLVILFRRLGRLDEAARLAAPRN